MPTSSIDVFAATAANGNHDAQFPKRNGKSINAVRVRFGEINLIDGVIFNDVHLCGELSANSCQLPSVLFPVVEMVESDVLEGDFVFRFLIKIKNKISFLLFYKIFYSTIKLFVQIIIILIIIIIVIITITISL